MAGRSRTDTSSVVACWGGRAQTWDTFCVPLHCNTCAKDIAFTLVDRSHYCTIGSAPLSTRDRAYTFIVAIHDSTSTSDIIIPLFDCSH